MFTRKIECLIINVHTNWRSHFIAMCLIVIFGFDVPEKRMLITFECCFVSRSIWCLPKKIKDKCSVSHIHIQCDCSKSDDETYLPIDGTEIEHVVHRIHTHSWAFKLPDASIYVLISIFSFNNLFHFGIWLACVTRRWHRIQSSVFDPSSTWTWHGERRKMYSRIDRQSSGVQMHCNWSRWIRRNDTTSSSKNNWKKAEKREMARLEFGLRTHVA